ncbi:MAG: acyl-CoA dehydrogenase family protein [Candidatus Delongbacteria bacterium]
MSENPALTQLREEEQFFYETVRDFAREKVLPLREQMDHDGKMDPKLLKSLWEMGLMGIEIPDKWGGSEGSFFMSCLAIEAMSTVDAAVAVVVDVQNTLVINALLRWGSEDVKSRYLPLLAEKWLGAYALSEAGSGSDAFGLGCRAEEQDDHFVLNGQKLWITNAGEADLFLVFANINPAAGHKGITAFLVERGFAGFSVGKKEDKLGIRASSTCELVLKDCRVPKANVLGKPGVGYKVAIETLNEGRIGIGAQMVGLAQGCLDYTKNYLNERKQFNKPLAAFQGVQFQFAQAAAELEAARLCVYNAARLRETGKPFVREAAVAKLISSQMAQRVTSLCVDLLGGYGFVKEYPVEKFYRDAKIGTIYEGTTNMQLMTIAKLLLG